MLELHLEKLLSFHAAAQEKSLLKAASKLGLTQPAVGKNIKFIEDLLGVTLFTRHRRGVDLTPAGEQLSAFCAGLFLRVRDVESQIASTQEVSGVLRIGTYETLGASFWPEALSRLKSDFPELKIELITSQDIGIWNGLEEGSIDLIVDAEPRTGNQITSTVLFKDSFGIYSREKQSLEKLQSKLPMSFVKHAFDRHQQSIESHLARLGIDFELLYQTESFTFSKALAETGLCFAVLPNRLGESSSKLNRLKSGGKFIEFGEHRVCVSYRSEDEKLLRTREVLQSLKRAATSTYTR